MRRPVGSWHTLTTPWSGPGRWYLGREPGSPSQFRSVRGTELAFGRLLEQYGAKIVGAEVL